MDFRQVADDDVANPYAGKTPEGEWVPGFVSVDYLDEHFGSCKTLDECSANTDSEGLKLFFEHLKDQE